jgi:hypothetical protein
MNKNEETVLDTEKFEKLVREYLEGDRTLYMVGVSEISEEGFIVYPIKNDEIEPNRPKTMTYHQITEDEARGLAKFGACTNKKFVIAFLDRVKELAPERETAPISRPPVQVLV